MSGLIDVVQVGIALGFPSDSPADDGDDDGADPANQPGLQDYTVFADFLCEIRDIRGSDFSRSSAISLRVLRCRMPRSSTIQNRDASARPGPYCGRPSPLPCL